MNEVLFTLGPAPTQAQTAYRLLEEAIVTLQLAPGSRISEASVAQKFGLGRTPVREAMQRLAREGTLTILPRAGAIVSDIDLTDQLRASPRTGAPTPSHGTWPRWSAW